jgi:hypothetical protein
LSELAAVIQKHSVSKAALSQHRYVGQVEINILAQQLTDACVPKVVAEAQPTVLQELLQYIAVILMVIFAEQTTAEPVAVLFVTTVQEQDHAVQNRGVVILINVADLAALHSGHAGQIVHVQHRLTWQFHQVYLPATVQW